MNSGMTTTVEFDLLSGSACPEDMAVVNGMFVRGSPGGQFDLDYIHAE